MAQTQIPVGSPLARKVYGAKLFTRVVQVPSFVNRMTDDGGGRPQNISKLKGQTAPGMPFVRVTDLAKTQGDTISIDLVDTVRGKPIVGDRSAEGTGEKLALSSMDVRIDLLTKVIDAGSKMANQRGPGDLRDMSMAQLQGYFPRLYDQVALTHLSGARGSMTGRDWIVPTATDADFSGILCNTVKAPTYNRHFVADTASAGAVVQGGQQLNLVDTADIMTLEHIDTLSLLLDDFECPIQPIKVNDDPAADDDPIKGVLWVTPRQWYHLQTAGGTSNLWRTFLQNAWARKSYGTKHPLFSGEPGMWNGILVRKMPRFTVRFASAETGVKYVAAADRYTATESSVTVATIAGYAVDRAILTGAQALAMCYGRNSGNGLVFNWLERKYNLDRGLEIGGDAMFGMAKVRASFVDATGTPEPTDHGVVVVDSVVKL